MTRTDLLSLAERLDDPRDPLTFLGDAHEAAAILRKLAELRPVAWLMEYGAVSLPVGHASRITGLDAYVTEDEAKADAESCDFDKRIFSVYQLSEVLTDE